MTRRPPPAEPTYRPHPYLPDPATPGCCMTCNFPQVNGAHDEARMPAPDPDRRAAELRRTGERED